jgi:hypothetical protein
VHFGLLFLQFTELIRSFLVQLGLQGDLSITGNSGIFFPK